MNEELFQALQTDLGSTADHRLRRWLPRAMATALFGGPVDATDAALDFIIEQVEGLLCTQVDEILHHPMFQQMEAAWRGLRFVVQQTRSQENIRVEILNCSKDDLQADFEDAPEVPKSGLYKIVYSGEYGPFGGRPYASVIANYEFSPGPQDVMLLQKCGEVAGMAALAFIAQAAPTICGRAKRADLAHGIDNNHGSHSAWHRFRQDGRSRNVVLTLQRIVGRTLYGHAAASPKVIHARRQERIKDANKDILWLSSANVLGALIVRSFAVTRLACHVTGPAYGALESLPVWNGSPLETELPQHVVDALFAEGIVALTPGESPGSVVVSRAPTCISKSSPSWVSWNLAAEDIEANATLPGILFVNQLVQLCKVLQREKIGSWKSAEMLRTGLGEQLNRFVSRMPIAEQQAPTAQEQTLLDGIQGFARQEPILVYADWLEERGRIAESEYIKLRFEAETSRATRSERYAALDARIRELDVKLDPVWLDRIRRSRLGTSAVLESSSFDVHDKDRWWFSAELRVRPRPNVFGQSPELVAMTKLDKE